MVCLPKSNFIVKSSEASGVQWSERKSSSVFSSVSDSAAGMPNEEWGLKYSCCSTIQGKKLDNNINLIVVVIR